MRIAFKTDKGKKHKDNDDAILVDQERGLFLLADGMGGCQGKVASRMAVEEAYACLKDRIHSAKEGSAVSNLLGEAIAHAHVAITGKSKIASKLKGMGSTLMIMAIRGNTAHICHVGDSRAYIIRGALSQLTTDHTLENSLYGNSSLSELFLLQKPRVLSQAVGATKKIDHETIEIAVQPDDVLLLCTDGLTDMLTDEEIAELIRGYEDKLQDAADILIAGANIRGGKDDISVVLVAI